MSQVQPGNRIAVTGATGFVGQILVKHLAVHGYEVVGVSESAKPPPGIADYLHAYRPADLTRGWPKVRNLAGLVHLAGLAAVGPSFDRPQEYITTNSAMITHLFEQALADGWQGRAIVVSSGAVYGGAVDPKGFTEESPLLATSPYVVSKLLVERQAEYYRRRGVDALVVRPFNHIGPGQHPGFIVPDLTAKVVAWQPGAELPVGNLDSKRDYTDVRDIVSAYQALLELQEPRDATYNVCTGVARSGREILEAICAAVGKPVPPTVATDHRAIDPSVITGNADRLGSETGWEPRIELQTSIDDFVASTCVNEPPIQQVPQSGESGSR
ncbi:NAD-dependent epimerase/dehydratase family protein [Mycolicibacterium mengxianglii]|uniref:NAD-dependent epimerase/dehydratase family protein n=1 Tax=Mycolicibacterium mengxianglii TaxID=2736649 RepID=UPI0018EEF4CE|nr:NAD-dependent epimerase/dehydratase family protein [Mycolicibacterium mengxianglii]